MSGTTPIAICPDRRRQFSGSHEVPVKNRVATQETRVALLMLCRPVVVMAKLLQQKIIVEEVRNLGEGNKLNQKMNRNVLKR